jgi:hypothetical protein
MSERKAKIERLELNRETLRDLTESEAEGVAGGMMAECGSHHQCPTKTCLSRCPCPDFD